MLPAFRGSTLALEGLIPPISEAVAMPSANLSGFDAANFSTRRGYVYFPQLNTQREVSSYSRLEMLRRSRYLTRNVGFAKRCTRGLAQMVGYLSPTAITDDKEWNTLAGTAWERGAGRANTFDLAGRFNVYSYQPMVTSTRLTDGDLATILTSSAAGDRAMVATYEGHQIGNGTGVLEDSTWRDGMRIFLNRAVAMRLMDPDNPANVTEIAAQNFILHADYLSFGHSRGITALHHAINNLLDRTEVWSDLKLAIKIAGKQGFYIERANPVTTKRPPGMGEGRSVQQNDAGDNIYVENLTRGGKLIGLQAGEKIQQLLDQRPHPNSREFLEDLNRDIAWGIGLSPDVLWNIAKLGGASVRYVLADAQVWIEAQQQLLVDQFLHRFWVYFISKEIKSGRLRPPTDPEWWWKVGWQPPAKLTVDIGRDGKLSIDLHRAGMLTLSRWFGSQGLDYQHELKQHVREYAMKLKIIAEVEQEFGVKLEFDKVFPPAPGSSPNLAADPQAASDPNFGDPQNIQSVILEIRDDIAALRAA